MNPLPHRALFASLALAAASAAHAQEWAGVSPGVWNVPANWTLQTVPDAIGAQAVIRTAAQGGSLVNTGAFNITAPITLGGLTIDRDVSGPGLNFNGSAITFDNGANPATLFTSGFLGLNISNPFVLQSDLHVDAQGPNGFVFSAISGPGGIVADSDYPSARLRLRGVNTYEGETIIRDSEIGIAQAANLGAHTAGTTVEGGGKLTVEVITNPTIDDEALTILDNGILWMRSGNWAGDITITNGARTSALFDDEECEISGRISGTGPLTKSSAQSQFSNDATRESITTISNPMNDFTGGVIIHSGVLSIPDDGVLGDAAYGLFFDQTPGFTEGPPAFATSQTTAIAREISMLSPGWLRAEAGTTATYTGEISGLHPLQLGFLNWTGTIVFPSENFMTGPVTVRAGTLLVNNPTGSGTGSGDVIVEGLATVGGTGTIGASLIVTVAGAVAPGESAGALTVNGDATFSGGVLRIELGDTTPGAFDRLIVGGDVELVASRLEVSLINESEPQDGSAFEIVAAASIDGKFEMTDLPPGFSVEYTDTTITLRAGSAETCPGDVTGDNVVDFSDLNALLVAFGASGMDLPADLDGSGTVGFSDLNQLLVFFGTDCL